MFIIKLQNRILLQNMRRHEHNRGAKLQLFINIANFLTDFFQKIMLFLQVWIFRLGKIIIIMQ